MPKYPLLSPSPARTRGISEQCVSYNYYILNVIMAHLVQFDHLPEEYDWIKSVVSMGQTTQGSTNQSRQCTEETFLTQEVDYERMTFAPRRY